MTETINHVISNDGTRIGYRQVGTGQGLILCHGGGRISQNYRKLALALADTFTIYIPDRRGRGLSEKEGSDYNMKKSTEDLAAIIGVTNADFIFGHSAGGLIALETMLLNPVKKIAVYEPPISVNHSFPWYWLSDFENALAHGRLKKAMVIMLKGLQVLPEISKMPNWGLTALINIISLVEVKKEKGTRMLDLLHTLPADIKMAMALDSSFERYRNIHIPVHLLAGSKSPSYFHIGLETLKETIPQRVTKIFDGFDHYSPEEKATQISAALKQFYCGEA